MNKKLKKIFIGLSLLGIFGAAGIGTLVVKLFYSPINKNDVAGHSILLVPRGSTFNSVTRKLKNLNLIAEPRLYRKLAHYMKAHSRIQAGEFKIEHQWNTHQLLTHLISGKSIRHRITIPEGKNFTEIAERLGRAELGDKDIYLSLRQNPTLLKKTGIAEATSLEGFLFPETYFFSRADTEAEILSAMIAQHRSVFNADFSRQANEIGMSEYQVLILASIVEKETGSPADRPMVAAVFHNRLKKRMRLDSDPTVIYRLSDFDGNLNRKHLRQKTPYNTYTMYGLPPTPISNPGKASLESVLKPAQNKYLYFVARGDGSSQFSKTLKEHNKAVWYYQKIRKNRQAMRLKRLQNTASTM